MEGFFTGILLAVCKLKEAEVKQVKCASDGDKYCKFEAKWK
jgi:predicted hydrocarbon binding protein